MLPVSKGFFEGVLSGEIAGDAYAEDDEVMGDAGLGWGDADIDIGEDERVDPLAMAGIAPDVELDAVDDENDGWGMDDIELPDDVGGAADADTGALDGGIFIAPRLVFLLRDDGLKSGVAGEHVAAGEFDSA